MCVHASTTQQCISTLIAELCKLLLLSSCYRKLQFYALVTQQAKIETLLSECTWKAGEPVPFSYLCDVFEKIAVVSGRLDIQVGNG
jgi:hypothetical protein